MAESGVVSPWEMHVDGAASPHTPVARTTLEIMCIDVYIILPHCLFECLNDHTSVAGQGASSAL